jgi:hypothetical protein
MGNPYRPHATVGIGVDFAISGNNQLVLCRIGSEALTKHFWSGVDSDRINAKARAIYLKAPEPIRAAFTAMTPLLAMYSDL